MPLSILISSVVSYIKKLKYNIKACFIRVHISNNNVLNIMVENDAYKTISCCISKVNCRYKQESEYHKVSETSFISFMYSHSKTNNKQEKEKKLYKLYEKYD